jgi:hypothetical protein
MTTRRTPAALLPLLTYHTTGVAYGGYYAPRDGVVVTLHGHRVARVVYDADGYASGYVVTTTGRQTVRFHKGYRFVVRQEVTK